MKKWISVSGIVWIAAILLLAGLYVLCAVLAPYTQAIVADYLAKVKAEDAIFTDGDPRPVIILDPGHGGEDSGAVGIDGVYEKDLNLSVAEKLCALLRFEGWTVIMTRSDDRLLYDPSVALSHKTQDLKTRLDYGRRYPDGVFVSIHMNKFPAESCQGLQIYYSNNHPDSQRLAADLQGAVQNRLSPDNHREIKSATSSIYILHRIQIPAILIECGFISNREESALLQDENYQNKLIAIIADGLTRQLATAKSGGEGDPAS